MEDLKEYPISKYIRYIRLGRRACSLGYISCEHAMVTRDRATTLFLFFLFEKCSGGPFLKSARILLTTCSLARRHRHETGKNLRMSTRVCRQQRQGFRLPCSSVPTTPSVSRHRLPAIVCCCRSEPCDGGLPLVSARVGGNGGQRNTPEVDENQIDPIYQPRAAFGYGTVGSGPMIIR